MRMPMPMETKAKGMVTAMLTDKNNSAQAERLVLMIFSSLRVNIRSAAAKPRAISSGVWFGAQDSTCR